MICSQCGSEKGNRRKCKECNRLYQQKWYKANQEIQKQRVSDRHKGLRKKLYEYFATHPCEHCGFTNPFALHFHHKSEKFMNISQMVQRGHAWERIQTEIDKCQVLCANCHAIETASEFGWYKDILDG